MEEKMKIAIIADPLDNQNAGVHIYTKSLVMQLLEQQADYEIILIRQKMDAELKGVEQIVVPNIQLPIGYASLRLFFIIPYILRKKQVDVVIEPAHFGPFNLSARTKRVTVIHDLTPIKFPQHHRWHSQILQRLFLGGILKRADLIITNSKNTSKDLEQYYPITKHKNKAILLGKEAMYQPSPNPAMVKELGIYQPFFLFVGTIEPRKNLLVLLEAYETFCAEEGTHLELVIVGGKGWKSQTFEAALENHPNKQSIRLLGYVKKEVLPVLYTHTKAFIYPSLYEGFGFPVLEAMACGTPVICSNTSSLPEVGGEIAHYFNPDSSNELFDLMKQISKYDEKERQIILERSLEHASQYSWKKYTDGVLAAIATL